MATLRLSSGTALRLHSGTAALRLSSGTALRLRSGTEAKGNLKLDFNGIGESVDAFGYADRWHGIEAITKRHCEIQFFGDPEG